MINLFEALKTGVQLKRYDRRLSRKPAQDDISQALLTQGYYCLENFLPRTLCSTLCQEIDRAIQLYPQQIHQYKRADTRLFGFEKISLDGAAFAYHETLNKIVKRYHSQQTQAAFCMAARLPAMANSVGSGNGWHRDALYPQIKAIVYLTDTALDNGPFQCLPGTHRIGPKCHLVRHKIGPAHKVRFTSDDILQIQRLGYRIETLTAQAGTVILADTSMLHRGKPIQTGVRYALTNYYYEAARINEALYAQFAPVLGYEATV